MYEGRGAVVPGLLLRRVASPQEALDAIKERLDPIALTSGAIPALGCGSDHVLLAIHWSDVM